MRHLNDDDFAALLLGGESPDEPCAAHLASCPACAVELGRLRGTLDAARRELDLLATAAPSRPANVAVFPPRSRPALRLALVAAMVLAAVGLGLLLARRLATTGGASDPRLAGVPQNTAAPAAATVAAGDDEELLAAVSSALARRSATALAPAELLAGELATPPLGDGGGA